MAEWLVEQGIGEERRLLVEDGTVLAARMYWPGELRAGMVVAAKLSAKTSGSSRGMAMTEDGQEILLDRLPNGATEGVSLDVRITRASIAERGRLKAAQGRPADSRTTRNDTEAGRVVRCFPTGLWEDVWDAAWDGAIGFAGGSVLFATTPAMSVIDIDGDLPPRQLAMAALPAIARGFRWFDLAGSIAIDFPTLAEKSDRKAVDEALGKALTDWPHERTAMNGFGLVHLVARLEGPSLLHRMAASRVSAAARMVLRKAELLDGAGGIQLTVHPAVKVKLKRSWLDELGRRTGREVRVLADPAIALGAGHAQMVER